MLLCILLGINSEKSANYRIHWIWRQTLQFLFIVCLVCTCLKFPKVIFCNNELSVYDVKFFLLLDINQTVPKNLTNKKSCFLLSLLHFQYILSSKLWILVSIDLNVHTTCYLFWSHNFTVTFNWTDWTNFNMIVVFVGTPYTLFKGSLSI